MSLLIVSDSPRKFEFLLQSKLNGELLKLENVVLNPEELHEKARGRVVLLRISNMYKLIPISVLVSTAAKCAINRVDLVLRCFNRELLYSTLSASGIQVPRRYYIFDICNISDVRDKVRGKTLLLTFTKSDIEGFVESPQALVSLVEHRYYMSAEDVKVNLFIPQIESCWEVLVVGKELIPYSRQKIEEEVESLAKKVCNVLGDGIYLVKIGRQDEKLVVLDVDPVPELREEHFDKVIEYLRTLL